MGMLLENHLQDLRHSGLNDDTIKELGFRSGSSEEVAKILGFDVGPGLIISYPCYGNSFPFFRVKPDTQPVFNGKSAKYLSPKGAEVRAFIPPETYEALKDPHSSTILTEGEKKAAKANQEGFSCIGLSGVNAFFQDHKLIPDLKRIAWNKRTVSIAFDSDVAKKDEVKDATFSLERELVLLGADTGVIRFNCAPDGSKVGIDDFLVSQGSDALRELLKQRKPSLNFEIDDIIALPAERRLQPIKRLFRKLARLEPVEIQPYRELCLTHLGILRRDFQNQLRIATEDLKRKLSNIKDELDNPTSSAPPVATKTKESAMALLKHPALLYRVGETVHHLGVCGEETNTRLIYLAVTSRIIDRPISITPKGDSSSGKSYAVTKVLDLFPSSAYILMTAMSRQALIYMADTESFAHRTVVIFELPGANKADYAIRTLQSEGKLIFWVPQKDPQTERWITVKIEKEGPTNFIITTTSPEIDPENETRQWSLVMDESPQVTLGSKIKSAERYLDTTPILDAELDVWRQVQAELKPAKVYIPYAKWLAEHTPNKPIRIRRDFNKLLSLIEVISILYQYQRQKRGEVVVASLEDYYMARELAEDVFAASLSGLNAKVKSLVAEVQKQWVKNGELASPAEGIKPVKIANALGISRSTVSRWLEPAIGAGVVDVVSEGSNGSIRSVKPGNVKEAVELLPTIEQIADEFPQLAKDFHAVHPITGKQVALSSEETERENNDAAWDATMKQREDVGAKNA